MQLLIALIIAGAIGYLVAGSRYSEKIDQTTDRVSETSGSLVDRTRRWWRRRGRGLFGRDQGANPFVSWATGEGAGNFPAEFTGWLKSLSPQEADRFTDSLAAYCAGLDYDLDELVSGEMGAKPALMQVFVEAVVVYSHEYRKAQEAQTEASSAEKGKSTTKKASEADSSDGKAVAEKQPSRRKGAIKDSPQPTAAG